MKLKRLSSLVGLLAALLIFTGGNAFAVDAVAVADAQAFPGGSDTVDVLVTTNQAYAGAEVTLSFDNTKLNTTESSVIVNQAAWDPSWGDPQVSVDTAAGTIKVGLLSLTNVDAEIPQSSSALKLFSVIFGVDSTVAVGSYTITPSGFFTLVDENFDPSEVDFASITAGTFVVQSLYNMSVDSVSSGPGVMTPVGVNLSNGREIVSVEFTIAYDSSQVVYADSVEINDLYVGGEAVAPEVTDFGDSVKVAIYTVSAGTIPVSNTSRALAMVYFTTADGAVESASNPLTLTTNTSVVTRDENYDLVENSPNLAHGNFNIQSQYSLRVGDASAPQGGSDTVMVYLRSAETINAVEAEIFFDSSNFTVTADDVMFNDAIFLGGASTSITVTDSSVKVIALPAVATDSIGGSNTERQLFSAILMVKETAAAGYDSINASGILTGRDENYDPTEITVASITKGAFRVLSPYEIEVKSRAATPEAKGVPISILLTNQMDIFSTEVVIKYDTTSLSYVEGSIAVMEDIWTGTAPTPDITVGGDSIKIGLFDISDVNNKIAGGSAGRTLLTIDFDVDSSLSAGDSTMLTPSGLLAGRDENFDPIEYTPAGVAGYLKIQNDIIPPGPVTSAMATRAGTSANLSWRNPTDSDLDYVKIVRRDGSSSVTVVTRDTPVPGATDSFEDTGAPSGTLWYDFMVADLTGNMGDVVTVQVGDDVVAGTGVRVSNVTALSGGVARPRIRLTNTEDDIRGLQFKLTFDNSILTLTDVVPGAGAAGLAPVGTVDIDGANASGELTVSMIDVAGDNPVMASATVKTVAVVHFMVDSSTADGVMAAFDLSDVSLSDPDGNEVVGTTTDGTLTIVGSITLDMNRDGEINIGDLWYYVNMEEMRPFEALAELIAYLLAQPLPSSSLAAVQDAVSTNYRVIDGAALIDLKTDYEITAARFTFSYDSMYQLSDVNLVPSMAGKMMFKKVVADGRLYVDVISLTGFVPAEVGNLFSVAFRDTDYQSAGLTLERVEMADRDGNVHIEAAALNRIALPKAYSLSQNSPNPFNPSTTISYQVPEGESSRVQIVVYNVRGQKVITLVDELKESGTYTVNWNGTSASGQRVSSGVYFYRMSAGEFSAMRKMVIVK